MEISDLSARLPAVKKWDRKWGIFLETENDISQSLQPNLSIISSYSWNEMRGLRIAVVLVFLDLLVLDEGGNQCSLERVFFYFFSSFSVEVCFKMYSSALLITWLIPCCLCNNCCIRVVKCYESWKFPYRPLWSQWHDDYDTLSPETFCWKKSRKITILGYCNIVYWKKIQNLNFCAIWTYLCVFCYVIRK